ncbi:hypothetical protein [Streptomyces sp. NPDC007264]|uniref:hypothetical protein n=1 Tax=Streptomyces sp. NPDC007264 TaxID=3364777 RepID=UPI0036D80222
MGLGDDVVCVGFGVGFGAVLVGVITGAVVLRVAVGAGAAERVVVAAVGVRDLLGAAEAVGDALAEAEADGEAEGDSDAEAVGEAEAFAPTPPGADSVPGDWVSATTGADRVKSVAKATVASALSWVTRQVNLDSRRRPSWRSASAVSLCFMVRSCLGVRALVGPCGAGRCCAVEIPARAVSPQRRAG